MRVPPYHTPFTKPFSPSPEREGGPAEGAREWVVPHQCLLHRQDGERTAPHRRPARPLLLRLLPHDGDGWHPAHAAAATYAATQLPCGPGQLLGLYWGPINC